MRATSSRTTERIRGKAGVRVFGDHLIDFGVEGMPYLGRDVIVLNGEPREWDPNRGVFPVKEMAARPLFVVELTSPTTRRRDLTEKPGLFYRAGVSMLVLVDLPYGGGKRPNGIVAYQAGPTGYEELPPEPNGWGVAGGGGSVPRRRERPDRLL
jgi:Uma2 family endonuclease